jgi:hypothetical protein
MHEFLSRALPRLRTTIGKSRRISFCLLGISLLAISASASQYGGPTPVPPTIILNPASQTVTSGQSVTFSVIATGDAPMSYQWLINGAPAGGPTASPYFYIPTTITANSGAIFSVIVSNDAGSAISSTATLTVNAGGGAPTITSSPASQTVTSGQSVTFSVAAAGDAPMSYQWLINGAPAGGPTASPYFYIPTTITANSGAIFSVIVSNDAGSATSSSATLTVNPGPGRPTITSNPASQTVTSGQSVTFSVAAAGDAPMSYQWLIDGAPVSGATSSSFYIPTTIVPNSGATFAVVVSNDGGSVTSSTATLTVNPGGGAPTITSNPASQTVTAGQSVTFSVAATGAGPLSYQWLLNGAPVSGSTSTYFYIPTTIVPNSGATFAVIVSNSSGSVTSNIATLTVNPSGGMLTASPSSLSFGGLAIGGNLAQAVTVTNTGNASVTVYNVSISGAGFTPSGLTMGQILPPGSSATMLVIFLPLLNLNASGSITINSNAINSPLTISLSGGGTQSGPHSVTLTWAPSPTSSVIGYNVYRSSYSGGEPQTSPINGATPIYGDGYVDTNVVAGATYYYAVTAVDATGVQSSDSSEISAVVPSQ